MKISYTVTVILTNPFRQVKYLRVMAIDDTDAIQRAKSMCRNALLVSDGHWSAREVDDEDADFDHVCGDCGRKLQAVRPGKWQCNYCDSKRET